FAGVLLMEAVKQTFAVKPKGHAQRVRRVRPLLAPSPSGAGATQAPVSQAPKPMLRRGLLEAGREGLSFETVGSTVNGKAAP
ncbi:MAG: hypothetical protein ACXWK0_14620, partial [Caulobacteraceae bacterium]